MESQMQQLTDAGVAIMQKKLKTVKRSFEIVAEHANVLQKACSKVEAQWHSLSDKQELTLSDIKKLEGLLRSIREMTHHRTKPLNERFKDLQTELGKKVESRPAFLEKSRNDIVPETALKRSNR